jgi:aminoglycoside phosphotransferase (APT) family kinase protein
MDDIVRAIAQREGLEVRTIQPLSGGQINRVLLINGDQVMRIASGPATERLQWEAKVLQSVATDVPVPRLDAWGRYGDSVYQIQQHVQGQRLHHVWGQLRTDEQEQIVADLACALRALHQRTFPSFGYPYAKAGLYGSWLAFSEDELSAMLAELRALRVPIPPEILRPAVDYFERHKQVLLDSTPVLVHGDFWPGNILVQDGRVAAILDFEFAIQAPRDYELWMIEQFCLYPNDWAEDGYEVYCTVDFVGFFALLRAHYPELFSIRDLRLRLNLHHLLSSLRGYLTWARGDPATRAHGMPLPLVAKMANTLWDHGARMF